MSSLSRHIDTIAAPVTAIGGAVGIIRVCGPLAWTIAQALFSPWPDRLRPREARFGNFSHGDNGLLILFARGASFTGDETAEFQIHGSRASMQELLDLTLELGARMAEPGEFTLRAFLNGKIDLTQAEGIRESVEAQSRAQLRRASMLAEGTLRDDIRGIRTGLIGILARVEAATDFGEETGDLDRLAALKELDAAQSSLDRFLASRGAERLVSLGLNVAIVGRPNAGKSSLLNHLTRSDRAIVTAEPGTTRDTIEETVALSGFLIHLIDTAGIRASSDLIERLGIDRTLCTAEGADLVLYLYDSQIGWTEDDDEILATVSRPHLILANKADLAAPSRGLPISALTGLGIPELLAKFVAELPVAGGDLPPLLPRHFPLLVAASGALAEVRVALTTPVPDDLAAVGLHSAVRTLGEITGETTPPDVIHRMFADFCIGK